MITFLQQSLSNRNTFATVVDPTKATHFQRDGGPIRTVADLLENDEQEVTPMDLPTMNFGDEETNNYDTGITDEVQPLEILTLD